ncbi:MAG: sigma-70 family RNA polymerase sigma factor [bacterium]
MCSQKAKPPEDEQSPPTKPHRPQGPVPPKTEEEVAQQVAERRLLRRLRRGDQRAFAALVRTYQQRVFNMVFRMLGNREEAEDVAQDVFVTVFQSAASFRGDSKFSTWLYRVTINHCKNRLKYLKRRGRHMGRPLDEIAEHELARGSGETQPTFHSSVPRPDDLAAGRQLERIIQEEMARMEEDHRLLLVLRDIQGLSYQEMAELTGLNVGTIKSRLHRARLALKEALTRQM